MIQVKSKIDKQLWDKIYNVGYNQLRHDTSKK